MVFLSNIPSANALSQRRAVVREKLRMIDRPNGIMVMIGGSYQSQELANLAKPVIRQDLTRQLDEIEGELTNLGIDIDA